MNCWKGWSVVGGLKSGWRRWSLASLEGQAASFAVLPSARRAPFAHLRPSVGLQRAAPGPAARPTDSLPLSRRATANTACAIRSGPPAERRSGSGRIGASDAYRQASSLLSLPLLQAFFSSSIARKASWPFLPDAPAAAASEPPAGAPAATKVVPGGTDGAPPPDRRDLRPSRFALDFGLGAGRRRVAGVRLVDEGGGPSPPPTVPDDDDKPPAPALPPPRPAFVGKR